jgi:hypothetical protein
MCSIAGFVLRDRDAQLATLAAMCGQIRHRGPDDEGFYLDGPCDIGMRRLSIIDLETGHQPLANEDGSVWERRKMGFGVPLGAWFRGPLREILWDHVSNLGSWSCAL